MRSFGTLRTPVGTLGVICRGDAITDVGWRLTCPDDAAETADPLLTETLDQLAAYFGGGLRRFDVPVDLGEQSDGTRAVLTYLHESVLYGESITYGELAERSGSGIPARGIGAIMGANPVPIIVPCHRVLASDGLGGYSGGEHGQGLATKRWLLEFEGVLPPPLF
ncbi:cysteine methyltransferase [Microbacterium mangrovi]|uniref:Methylated-DNA--protein-cysteine methyltransferase n=1 Tax=Microbacterium mangrovi TaxID=1348253 RepID=A0A0B2A3Q9_9MICO|nr:methylated-DNA--[protein]-cysteine S-methyltransferase [Microbacterium mangrovi]KHK96217.1 cysteine methyltransferase [Microbacterium mangrovi]